MKNSDYMVAFSAVICIVLTGCTKDVFTNIPASHYDSSVRGISYFLPKTLIKIKLTPLGYAANSTAVVELTEKQADQANSLGAIVVSATIDGKRRRVRVDKDGKLKNSIVTGLEMEIDEYVENNESKPYRQIPDPDRQYALNYNSSVFSSDKVCAGTKTNGLLKYVQASTTDETGKFAIAVAQLAGRVAGPDALGTTPLAVEDLTGAGLQPVVVEIDPLNSNDHKSVEQAIRTHFPSLKQHFDFDVDGLEKLTADKTNYDSCGWDNTICYRTMVPARLVLKLGGRTYASTYASVANRKYVNKVDIRRAFLVEKVTTLDFTDGVLSRINIKKPSEALQIAKLPLTLYDTILTSLLSAPGEFLNKAIPFTDPAALKTAVEQENAQVTAANNLRDQLKALRKDGTEPADLPPLELTCS